MSKIGATLGGLCIAVLVGAACVPPPPPPPPPGGTTSPPTTSKPLPNTPDGETFLAGKPAPAYDGDANRVQISGDGNWVVYHHKAENLAVVNKPPPSCPKPARINSQIYRTNLVTGVTELVSVDPVTKCYANGESSFPDTNSNGRYVAYGSRATNLVASDTRGNIDIFVKDMVTGVTSLLSVPQTGGGANQDSNRPDLSDDGSIVVFNSRASNLVPGDTNGVSDCFLTQRSNPRAVERVSLSVTGGQLDAFTYRCQIDGGAHKMVFDSQATNALGSPISKNFRVYMRNLDQDTTILISRKMDGRPVGAAVRPDISSNGKCVAFQSSDAQIVPGDTDSETDVFLQDLASGTTRIMSVARSGAQVAAASTRIVINADCTEVAFVSNSGQLVPEDRNGTRDVFMRELSTNRIFLLSVNSAEQQAHPCPEDPSTTTTTTTTLPDGQDTTGADDISTRPAMSDDGAVIAYISDTCGLVPEEPQMAGYDGVIVRSFR